MLRNPVLTGWRCTRALTAATVAVVTATMACGGEDRGNEADEQARATPVALVERPLPPLAPPEEVPSPAQPAEIAPLDLTDCRHGETPPSDLRVRVGDVIRPDQHRTERWLEIDASGRWRSEADGRAWGEEISPRPPWKDTHGGGMDWRGRARGRLSRAAHRRLACVLARVDLTTLHEDLEHCAIRRVDPRRVYIEITQRGYSQRVEFFERACGDPSGVMHGMLREIREAVAWERLYGWDARGVPRNAAEQWVRTPSCFDLLRGGILLRADVSLTGAGAIRLHHLEANAPERQALACVRSRLRGPGWSRAVAPTLRNADLGLAELRLELRANAYSRTWRR